MPELIIIFALALILIGPKQIPQIAKTIGKLIGDLKRSADDIKGEVTKEILTLKEEVEEEKKTNDGTTSGG
ncbi:MAG TPA: twin-arginine translocase TatA/TatE family subunit [bacterium]